MSYYKILRTFLVALMVHNTQAQEVDFLELVSDTLVNIRKNQATLKLVFEVSRGLHIQSNNPKSDSVIPTGISLDLPKGITAQKPLFPEAKTIFLQGADEPLQVFGGQFEVFVPIRYQNQQLKGQYTIPGKITYQACDHRRCFYPRELPFSVYLQLKEKM